MPSRSIWVFMCLRNSSALTCSPLIDWYAVRRKFTTDTPGISVGYCIARNRPRLARSSAVSAVMSSPFSSTCAGGDHVAGAAHDHVGQRRLARAVRAHQGVDLALAHGQVDPAQDLLALNGRVQPAHLERRGRRPFVISSSHLDPYVVVGHGHREGLATGLIAGNVRAAPVATSNSEPCFGHSIVPSSDVDVALVEEVMLVRADRIERAEPVVAEVDRRPPRGRRRGTVEPRLPARPPPRTRARPPSDRLRELFLDRELRAATHLVQGHAVENLLEEAGHDQPFGFVARDPRLCR